MSPLISQQIGLSTRGLDNQSWKAPSWRRSSLDDCHLKVVRAEATTSFIFIVHSVFHGPHLRPLSSVSATQKVNPSSNSNLNFTAACVMLKTITWSYHRHLAHHWANYSRNIHRWCSVVGKPAALRKRPARRYSRNGP